MVPSAFEREAVLFDFVQRYREDRDQGRELPVEHYLELFGGHEEAIRAEYRALEEADASPALALETIGGYRVLEAIGRGGQGTVLLAEDPVLGRRVALKVIHAPFGGLDPDQKARLKREVELAAQLEVPGICTVFGADLESDPPYVAMQYVEGASLKRILVIERERRSRSAADGVRPPVPVGPRTAGELQRLLAFVERLARSLHQAHECGVVHRDVKPANILVDAEGTPVLVDFGLARTESDTGTLTRTGERLGTPAYMSPEQIRGPSSAIDRRTDVFSLGLVLYECLTLERPFQGDSTHELERAICEDPPLPLNPAPRSFPAELRAVLECALAKDPARRYPTALELAEELRRVRTFEPVLAQRPSRTQRVRAWARRNPLVAATSLLALLSLTTALVVALVLLRQRSRALNRIEAERQAALAMHLLEEYPLAAWDLAVEADRRASSYTTRSALLAVKARRLPEWIVRTPRVPAGTRMLVSGEGERVLVANEAGGVSVLDGASGRELERWRGSSEPLGVLARDPVSGRLLGGDGTGRIFLWDGEGEPTELAPHASAVVGVEFGEAGTFASAERDGEVRRWNAEGALLASANLGAPLTGLRGSPDGRFLFACGEAGGWLLDPADLDRAIRLETAAAVRAVAFAPRGDLVAVGTRSGETGLWSVPAGTLRRTLYHPGAVLDLVWTQGGEELLAAFDPGEPGVGEAASVCAWDPRTGARLRVYRGHKPRAVADLALSPDGALLASAGYDAAVCVFEARTGRLVERFDCGRMAAGAVWSGDGKELFALTVISIAKWRLDPPRDLRAILRAESAVLDVSFAPDGESVVCGTARGRVHAVDVAARRELFDRHTAAEPVVRVALAPDGRTLLVGPETGAASVWSFPEGERRLDLDTRAAGERIWFSPGGGHAIAVDARGARSLRLADGGLEWRRDAPAAPGPAELSPDGRWLAFALHDGPLAVVSTRDGTPHPGWAPPTLASPYDLAFDAPGEHLLSVESDGLLRTWRLSDGRCVGALRVRFTPGQAVVPGNWTTYGVHRRWDGILCLLRLDPRRDGPEPRTCSCEQAGPNDFKHRDRVLDAVLSPGRHWIVTTSLDGTAKLWSAATFELRLSFAEHASPVRCAAVAPDDTRVVTGALDGSVWIWPVTPPRPAPLD